MKEMISAAKCRKDCVLFFPKTAPECIGERGMDVHGCCKMPVGEIASLSG